MSPFNFNSWNAMANEFDVNSAGEFSNNNVGNTTPGVRADFN